MYIYHFITRDPLDIHFFLNEEKEVKYQKAK